MLQKMYLHSSNMTHTIYSKWYLPLRLIKIHLDCDGTTFNESFLRLGQQKGAGSHGTKRAKILKSSVNKINSHMWFVFFFGLRIFNLVKF